MSKISKNGYDQIQVIKNALDSMYDKLTKFKYLFWVKLKRETNNPINNEKKIEIKVIKIVM